MIIDTKKYRFTSVYYKAIVPEAPSEVPRVVQHFESPV